MVFLMGLWPKGLLHVVDSVEIMFGAQVLAINNDSRFVGAKVATFFLWH